MRPSTNISLTGAFLTKAVETGGEGRLYACIRACVRAYVCAFVNEGWSREVSNGKKQLVRRQRKSGKTEKCSKTREASTCVCAAVFFAAAT